MVAPLGRAPGVGLKGVASNLMKQGGKIGYRRLPLLLLTVCACGVEMDGKAEATKGGGQGLQGVGQVNRGGVQGAFEATSLPSLPCRPALAPQPCAHPLRRRRRAPPSTESRAVRPSVGRRPRAGRRSRAERRPRAGRRPRAAKRLPTAACGRDRRPQPGASFGAWRDGRGWEEGHVCVCRGLPCDLAIFSIFFLYIRIFG